jgi:tripartite-type tricarboxylate transporter receptor subunit TctC
MPRTSGVALALALTLLPSVAAAQSVADFYRGKTVSVILGYSGVGSNAIYARAVARHIGRHIPGNPNVIFKTMPGAGSLVAANHLAQIALRDGTALGFVAATIPLEELLGVGGVKFRSAEFNWIGRIASGLNMTFVMHTSPVKSIQDANQREVVLGASGRSSTVYIYPAVLGNVIGARFRMVLGYASSPEAMLAMERGEVEGHSTSLEIVRALHPAWLSERKITILVQYALRRHRELPDVPMSWELGRTPEEQQILRIVANATEVGKMILAPPGIPAERVQALRRAFDATMKDPEFIEELNSNRVELDAMAGEDLQRLVVDLGATSQSMVARIKAVYPFN